MTEAERLARTAEHWRQLALSLNSRDDRVNLEALAAQVRQRAEALAAAAANQRAATPAPPARAAAYAAVARGLSTGSGSDAAPVSAPQPPEHRTRRSTAPTVVAPP